VLLGECGCGDDADELVEQVGVAVEAIQGAALAELDPSEIPRTGEQCRAPDLFEPSIDGSELALEDAVGRNT
jgi:hypothetical protein